MASTDDLEGILNGDKTGVIDIATFEQILEMDDDDEQEFSKSIVFGFFDQARSAFGDMSTRLEEKNLKELSQLGHFLKGSSATLGLTKVKDHCEKIQHFGAGKDETGDRDQPDKELSLRQIRETFAVLKEDCADAEQRLMRYFKKV